ncbi:MAG: stage II sporulation protein M [Acidobacteria bacterium]|nr:stage II sporulation protein M [Acidobacteriota bacterium]
MIVDLQRFVTAERPHWTRLEERLLFLERNPDRTLSIGEIEEFYMLYERAGAALVKIQPLQAEGDLRRYLESLVGRAYAEIHETRQTARFRFRHWVWHTIPETFRRRILYFKLSLIATLVGAAFGAGALALSYESKDVLMPFSHLHQKPGQRVATEMEERGKGISAARGRFSAHLMTHNIRVTLFVLALGVTFGLLSIVVLFYNGTILGAVCYDYITDGQGVFLAGWLLPHGSVEIPAILIGGQGALLLGHALIGWNTRESRADRVRSILPDLTTLAGAIGLLLVWAGIIESFFSQYHEPVIPYAVKIGFGSAQLVLLFVYLLRVKPRERM